jgi:signal transduction histidine kinase
VYYGIVLAATIATVAFEATGGGRLLAAAALAAMMPWHLAVGRPEVHVGHVSARAIRYVSGLSVLLAVAQFGSPWSSLTLFALCPQSFVLLPTWWATGAVGTFFLVPVLRQAGHPVLALGEAGVALGAVAFAATFGRWIRRIIGQSAERAELIEALAAAQDELARAEYDAGVLAERQRLTAEIHDTLAQGLTSILMLLQAADAAASPEEAKSYASQAARTARENLAEARGLMTDGPPAALSGSPLPEALRRLVARLSEETGIMADCAVTGEARWLPSAVEVVMLRCAQEALSNVRKHSGAANVALRLDYGPSAIRLCVEDDGRGFDPAPGRGLGLPGMSTRVAQVGGVLTVRSSPGAGTTLTTEVPA